MSLKLLVFRTFSF